MGSRMAQRLLAAGYNVRVYNRSPSAALELTKNGAQSAHSPRQAAEGCQFVIACVRDDEAARAVWLNSESGALAALSEGTIAIDSSTLSVPCARDLGTAAKKLGIQFLDAPVVGSRPQADAGQLSYLVGGEEKALERARPLLSVLGAQHFHVGASGSGAAFKLAVNSLFGVQVAALGELLGLLDKSGISGAAAMEVLGKLPITSPAVKGAGALMVAEKHEPLFPISLVEKDLDYLAKLAGAVGAKVPASESARQQYSAARGAGFEQLNISGVRKLF